MARYKIWDKAEPIYTLGPDQDGKYIHSAQEYIDEHAPWAAIPTVKVLIGGGPINGTAFMELGATVEHYRRQGAVIPDDATDDEIIAAIEDFEDKPPEVEPSSEERIAAALELANLLAIPTEE
jgi:hypothetical protein